MFKWLKRVVANKRASGKLTNRLSSSHKQEFQKPQDIGRNCPMCRGRLLIRNGKYGKFLGCSRFPDCTYTQSWKEYIWEAAVESQTAICNYLGIISGQRSCHQCKQNTRVSGIGLTTDNFKSIIYPEVNLLSFTGYDIYIVPWSDTFKQLPDQLQSYILNHYPIQMIGKKKNYVNICERCGTLQGNFYVYQSDAADSPFSYLNKSLLIFEKINLESAVIDLNVDLTATISPNCYYMKRSETRETYLD